MVHSSFVGVGEFSWGFGEVMMFVGLVGVAIPGPME